MLVPLAVEGVSVRVEVGVIDRVCVPVGVLLEVAPLVAVAVGRAVTFVGVDEAVLVGVGCAGVDVGVPVPPETEVAVLVGVSVAVPPEGEVAVRVGVELTVLEGVALANTVGVREAVGVAVAVAVVEGVSVGLGGGVAFGSNVAVRVGVRVGAEVRVMVGEGVNVGIRVRVGVRVTVPVRVGVRDRSRVAVNVADGATDGVPVGEDVLVGGVIEGVGVLVGVAAVGWEVAVALDSGEVGVGDVDGLACVGVEDVAVGEEDPVEVGDPVRLAVGLDGAPVSVGVTVSVPGVGIPVDGVLVGVGEALLEGVGEPVTGGETCTVGVMEGIGPLDVGVALPAGVADAVADGAGPEVVGVGDSSPLSRVAVGVAEGASGAAVSVGEGRPVCVAEAELVGEADAVGVGLGSQRRTIATRSAALTRPSPFPSLPGSGSVKMLATVQSSARTGSSGQLT